ncbi:hypothetical protein GCM10022243_51980 [Saccharothrix violaceirubra]|uniref:PE family protein n=1 Tax=Saccharothrix violaceirubra TaxID=413306 RepID=A0A7W7TAE8_9PSEU|nr:hypothetical protein [Saccharothrix violaceirubra]MBB4969501.1 hypothetical protein [Saccharothrix violaceirubra]
MAEDNGILGMAAGVGGAVGAAVGALITAEKALGKTMPGASASAQQFAVDKETVLQAGKIVFDQALRLNDALRRAERGLLVKLGPNADPVNEDVAAAWNARLIEGPESYAGRVRQYRTSLSNLVDQLREVAKQYGFTEDEVVSAMGVKSA